MRRCRTPAGMRRDASAELRTTVQCRRCNGSVAGEYHRDDDDIRCLAAGGTRRMGDSERSGPIAEVAHQLLTEIIEPLTGLTSVNLDQNLYDLGFDSMTMVHLIVQ